VTSGSLAEAILVGEVFATKPVWIASALAPAKPEIDCCDHRHHHGHSDTRSEAKSALGPTVDAGYDPAGFRVCVLTVSDRVSRGEAEDRSGPTACKSVASIPGSCRNRWILYMAPSPLDDCRLQAFPSR
jgi:hypothetical protein